MRRLLSAIVLPLVLQVSPLLAVSPQPGADMSTTLTRSAVATDSDSYLKPPSNRATGLKSLPEQYETSAALVAARSTTGVLAFDEAKMMHVRDLRPGMKGYGLSVFQGIRPERFEAEVVGVRHRVFPSDDMILCRLSSPYLKNLGVIAGMSGSPVYINDKLVGAVAYGWGFTDEPLAGVTSIESMLRVYNSTSSQLPESERSEGASDSYQMFMQMRSTLQLPEFWRSGGPASIDVKASEIGTEPQERAKLPETFTMEPLATPLFISSASPSTLSILQRVFSKLNVQPIVMAASGSGGSVSADEENSPGGKVPDLKALSEEMSGGYGLAIPMIEGDLSMAGVGTVSYRNGDRLVAFGHPMFQFGVVNYPMAPARINALVRSLPRPFKLGESLGQVGTVRQDRLPAIGGVVGPLQAPMFAIHCSVEDESYHGKRDYNFRVWADRDMGPMLAMSALNESIAAASRSGGDTVYLFESTSRFDDGTSLTQQNYLVDQSGGTNAAMLVGSDLGVLMNNPFKRVRPQAVDFHIRIAQRFPQARILAATLDKVSYRPGDDVTVRWQVQPYRKEIQELKYSFRLPSNLPDGPYELSISDAAQRMSIERMRNPGGEEIFDFQTLLRMLQRNYPRNKVYLSLLDADTGVTVKGNELPKLPGSVINTIQSSVEDPYFAPLRGNFLVDSELATNYEISGRQTLPLLVSRKPL